jgi:response regulator NasT
MRVRTPEDRQVLLVDDNPDRADGMARMVQEQGFALADRVAGLDGMAERVGERPGAVLVIGRDTVDRALLDTLSALDRGRRGPVVLFTEDARSESIHAAVAAGVDSYVVVGVNGSRVRAAIELASANHGSTRQLKQQLDEARSALEERKLVEKAKGIVMKRKRLGEAEAHAFLRQRAMQRGERMARVAATIIEAEDMMT